MVLPNALFLVVLVCFLMMFPDYSYSRNCNDGSIQDSDNFKVRFTKINLRYLSLPLPPKGTQYTKALESRLINDVHQAIKAERSRENVEGENLSQLKNKISTGNLPENLPIAFRISSVRSCVEIIAETVCNSEVGQNKCVDIYIEARSINLSLDNPAENLLDMIPRSDSPTIYANVPKPLMLLNPKFGVDFDKEFGFSQNVEISTNLLDSKEILDGNSVDIKSSRLDLDFEGKKSLSKNYYDSGITLTYKKFLVSKNIENIYGEVRFSASHIPKGDADFHNNEISLSLGTKFSTNLSLFKSIILEGGYAYKNNRFIDTETSTFQKTRENNFHFRTLLNGQIKRDVIRLGFWMDAGKTDDSVFSYKRYAGLAGYAKEFGKGNQTFGLEALFGMGKVTGDIPNYAYFYGNNELKNFMYEADNSDIIKKMPGGPLIRSFGSGQAINNNNNQPIGSNSYWHFNLNLSIPVSKWSKPLIPNEQIDLETDDPNCPIETIRDLIKCQGRSGETILAVIYKKRHGLSDEESAAKARNEFKAINSAIGYLVDQANLYSVKPLLMFDAAKFNNFNGINKVRYSFGGGIQFSIVIAKFEAGYMRTINPQLNDSPGNFTMRLYFQNLF